jgi:prephenate dehydrogenase
LCANGFRDATRIASGSPEMWRDIAVGNRRHLSRALTVFINDLTRLRQAVVRGDIRRLHQFLSQAKTRREKWQEVASPTSPE